MAVRYRNVGNVVLMVSRIFRHQYGPNISNYWRGCRSATSYKMACIQDLSIGNWVETTKSFTSDDLKLYAKLSGDGNPLHIDQQYAKGTQFGHCIVHGMLINGYNGLTIFTTNDRIVC